MSVLGCPKAYQVEFSDCATGLTVARLEDVVLEYKRGRDDSFDATVTVMAGAAVGCLDALRLVRSFATWLVIARDGQVQWEGVVTAAKWYKDRLVVEAYDVLKWLERRGIHDDYVADDTYVNHAAWLIGEAFKAPHDVGVLPYLDVRPGGISGEVEFNADADTAAGWLSKLLTAGVDITAAGRRIIISPETSNLGKLPELSDDNFDGDFYFIDDGLRRVTRAMVRTSTDTIMWPTDIPPEFAKCDLIETLKTDDTSLDDDTALDVAKNLVAAGGSVLSLVADGDGVSLNASAPIALEDLIPGKLLTINTTRTLLGSMRVLYRLVDVDVAWENKVESVKVSLTPEVKIE